MMALKMFLFALSCTVAVAQEASQFVPSVLKPAGINMEAVAPTPRRLLVQMDTAALRIAMTAWCADPTAAEANHGHIKNWDVSGVSDMSYLIPTYCGSGGAITRATFDEDLSAWDVSKVTTMLSMFWRAESFNQPLSAWDVSKVTDMEGTFQRASLFNQPLSAWDVSKVTNMQYTFQGASAFNQPLSAWDVSKVTKMGWMFAYASAFNQPLSAWDVSAVTIMQSMLQGASAFNQPLSAWDVSAVTTMLSMFSSASSFNQPLSAWDVSKVTNMDEMFHSVSSFNQPLSEWDVSAVTTMRDMFAYTSAFNQPLSAWDVSAVTDMWGVFQSAASFDQVLCWDVTNVQNKGNMFSGIGGGSVNGECTPCVDNEYRVGTICAPCAAGSFSSPSAGSTGADSCSAGPVGTCFHGATQVTFEDKTTKAMTELQVGDKIQTADIYGNLDFAPIISLPHKAGNSEMATFLKIVTDSGKSVQMTPGHLIPNCAGKMFSAKEVVVGDCVMTVDGKEAVTEITSATHFGVYTAVTAHALIVANGVIASPFSVENDPHHHNDGVPSSFVYFLNKITAKMSTTGLRGAKVE